MGECSLYHPDVGSLITGPIRAETLPQLWSEGAVTMEEGSERGDVPGSEDGERGHRPTNVGSL